MPESYPTLAQLLILNNENLADQEFTNLFNKAKALEVIPAITSSNGTVHQYLRETAAPTPGYRAINDGIENTVSVDTNVTVTLKILDATSRVDIAIADNYKNGAVAWIARETGRHLRQALFIAEKQIWYGDQSPGSTGGPEGIADVLPYLDSTGIVVNGGGDTANTGSSVYAVYVDSGMPEDGFAFVVGNSGNIQVMETTVIDTAGSATGTFPAYYTPAYGYTGLQIGSVYGIGRICNLTEDANDGLDDDLLSTLIAKFPADRKPTHFFMSRRSQRQLQQSRTATTITGTPAPFPTEAFGVQIVVTDSILDTEAIVTNTPT